MTSAQLKLKISALISSNEDAMTTMDNLAWDAHLWKRTLKRVVHSDEGYGWNREDSPYCCGPVLPSLVGCVERNFLITDEEGACASMMVFTDSTDTSIMTWCLNVD